MRLSAEALNHLLDQNSWAPEKLRGHAGRRVKLGVTPLFVTLKIDADGRFSDATGEAADAEISLTPGGALRMLFDRGAAQSVAAISGDAALAGAVGQVLQGLRWDAEEDLSRLIGDIPAHQLAQSSLKLKQELGRQAWSVAGMLAEYWMQEAPLIANRHQLETFSGEVDALRDAAERLEKRLQRLEQKA